MNQESQLKKMPLRRSRLSILMIISSMFFMYSSFAQSTGASGDTYISSKDDLQAVNWGVSDMLVVGTYADKAQARAYIRFDLGDIDPAALGSATLRVYLMNSSAALNLGIHEVTTSWEEGKGAKENKSIALIGEITWQHQPTITPDPMMYINPGQIGGKWIDIEFTPFVKRWLSGKANYGVALVTNENQSNEHTGDFVFCSREYEKADMRPRLIITTNYIRQGSVVVR